MWLIGWMTPAAMVADVQVATAARRVGGGQVAPEHVGERHAHHVQRAGVPDHGARPRPARGPGPPRCPRSRPPRRCPSHALEMTPVRTQRLRPMSWRRVRRRSRYRPRRASSSRAATTRGALGVGLDAGAVRRPPAPGRGPRRRIRAGRRPGSASWPPKGRRVAAARNRRRTGSGTKKEAGEAKGLDGTKNQPPQGGPRDIPFTLAPLHRVRRRPWTVIAAWSLYKAAGAVSLSIGTFAKSRRLSLRCLRTGRAGTPTRYRHSRPRTPSEPR